MPPRFLGRLAALAEIGRDAVAGWMREAGLAVDMARAGRGGCHATFFVCSSIPSPIVCSE